MRDQGRGLSSNTTVLFNLQVQKTRTHEAIFKIKLEADFPGGPGVKNPCVSAGDAGLTPGLGRAHRLRSR